MDDDEKVEVVVQANLADNFIYTHGHTHSTL